jgi:hypothetical protein
LEEDPNVPGTQSKAMAGGMLIGAEHIADRERELNLGWSEAPVVHEVKSAAVAGRRAARRHRVRKIAPSRVISSRSEPGHQGASEILVRDGPDTGDASRTDVAGRDCRPLAEVRMVVAGDHVSAVGVEPFEPPGPA